MTILKDFDTLQSLTGDVIPLFDVLANPIPADKFTTISPQGVVTLDVKSIQGIDGYLHILPERVAQALLALMATGYIRTFPAEIPVRGGTLNDFTLECTADNTLTERGPNGTYNHTYEHTL